MLIVNADDWGRDVETTDLIVEYFDRGSITSTTAMVYASDTERAAGIARDRGLPVGLHLNFAEPFNDACPPAIAARQARLVAYLSARPDRRWWLQPWLLREVRTAIRDQLTEFRRLYGDEPTHVDGHQHRHTWPTAILSRGLPRHLPVRRSFTFSAAEKPLLNRALRGLLNAAIDGRHASTTEFATLRILEPFRGQDDRCWRLELSRSEPVEIMVHPDRPDEREFLGSDLWLAVMAEYPLGTYADLPRA